MDHVLVPLHEKLSEEQTKHLFEQLHITMRELPKIAVNDPAIAHLDAQIGDVIRITRNSPTAGKVFFYRGVTNE